MCFANIYTYCTFRIQFRFCNRELSHLDFGANLCSSIQTSCLLHLFIKKILWIPCTSKAFYLLLSFKGLMFCLNHASWLIFFYFLLTSLLVASLFYSPFFSPPLTKKNNKNFSSLWPNSGTSLVTELTDGMKSAD